ncbi:MAG: P-protein PheA [Pirellulaceae bacterium]|nr:MAG: P-protein PheA [Pirellulaceae bacterium]
MVKKSKASRSGSPESVFQECRRLDQQLLKLLAERARLYERLARHRITEGQTAWDPHTEVAWQQEMLAAGAAPLSEASLRAILAEIQSGCRALIKPLRVAYLGPEHSYSYLAATARFGHSVELVPVATIAAVFEEVHYGQAALGVVPLENSTDGRVVDTLDMFARMPVRICGEVQLRIHHFLAARCPRDKITEVYSKPQALSQCRGWLARHLPGVRTIEMTSTARAAQIAAEKEGAAAIASREAAQHYGLEIVAANIEDNPNNITRFAVLGEMPSRRTGKDKTALMFQVPHRPGALADAMVVFKKAQLNLTWIESFPVQGAPQEYLFFAEFEGHESEARVKRALAALGKKTLRLNVLGSYAVAPPAE